MLKPKHKAWVWIVDLNNHDSQCGFKIVSILDMRAEQKTQVQENIFQLLLLEVNSYGVPKLEAGH